MYFDMNSYMSENCGVRPLAGNFILQNSNRIRQLYLVNQELTNHYLLKLLEKQAEGKRISSIAAAEAFSYVDLIRFFFVIS